MYGLKISNGDFAVKGDGNITEIAGGERIVQELSHWLIEPIGSDTIYKRFGSTLWDSVGEPLIRRTIDSVRSEVVRIVQNYVAYQKRQVNEDLAVSEERYLKNWSHGDIIDTVDSIEVSAVADTLNVKVKLTTVSGEQVVVSQSV